MKIRDMILELLWSEFKESFKKLCFLFKTYKIVQVRIKRTTPINAATF